MFRCYNCGHTEADHIPATPPAPFNSERWAVAKCFNWNRDNETYCDCEELALE